MNKKKKKNEKLICTSCGKEKNPTGFYVSHSPFHQFTSKLHVCKDCFWDYVGDDVKKLSEALRMIDKPFIMSLYVSSQEEAEKSDKNTNPIKNYMKNVSMPQYKGFTWEDSEFDSFKSSKSTSIEKQMLEIIEDEPIELNIEEIKLLKSFWGSFELDDLIWLQSEYEDWTNRYECDSKGMETLIQEICLTKLDIKTRRANGEKVDQQLKTLQDLLGSSNLKPVQETGANAVEQESFGTLIKKFEREKPIPEPDPIWKDVDGIGKYIRTFFFGHMARAIGAENKFQDEYDKELSKYTVKPQQEEDDYSE